MSRITPAELTSRASETPMDAAASILQRSDPAKVGEKQRGRGQEPRAVLQILRPREDGEQEAGGRAESQDAGRSPSPRGGTRGARRPRRSKPRPGLSVEARGRPSAATLGSGPPADRLVLVEDSRQNHPRTSLAPLQALDELDFRDPRGVELAHPLSPELLELLQAPLALPDEFGDVYP